MYGSGRVVLAFCQNYPFLTYLFHGAETSVSMQPNNVKSILAIGEDSNSALFKIAIHYAESGSNVWFINPEVFEKVPGNVKPPDKEVLQLITFLYLRDYKDLISHLNSIHLWQKHPSLIIVQGFDTYCNFSSENYNSLQAALVATSLLDATAVCAAKKNCTTHLLVTCKIDKNDTCNLQSISDLYFANCLSVDDNFYEKVILSYK